MVVKRPPFGGGQNRFVVVKNVAFSLKNVKKWWKKVIKFLKNDKNKNKNIQFLYKFKTGT